MPLQAADTLSQRREAQRAERDARQEELEAARHADSPTLSLQAQAQQNLQARPRATVSFLGPHAYMSPCVYPDLARVPTWNYLAMHCQVRARLFDHEDASGKDRLLKCLIGDHEPAYAEQWRSFDPELQRKLLAGIVAFDLVVQSWQCKLKLNQHRQEAHATLHALYAAGTPDERALAGWMETLGMVPPAGA